MVKAKIVDCMTISSSEPGVTRYSLEEDETFDFNINDKVIFNIENDIEFDEFSIYDTISDKDKLNVLYELCRGIPKCLKNICCEGKTLRLGNLDEDGEPGINISLVHQHILPELGNDNMAKYNYYNEKCQYQIEKDTLIFNQMFNPAYKKCMYKVMAHFRNVIFVKLNMKLERGF